MVPGATEKTLTVSGAGLYAVMVTVDQRTSVPSDAVSVVITGIRTPETGFFQAYPNPASDNLTVRFSGGGRKQLEIMSHDGKPVRRSAAGDLQTSVDISTLSAGLYLLKVSTSKKYRYVKSALQYSLTAIDRAPATSPALPAGGKSAFKKFDR